MPLRYIAGYSLLLLTRFWEKVFDQMWRVASLPERFVSIIWTTREIERYSRTDWNSWPSVRTYANADDWNSALELTLVERYFKNKGEILNLACGAGREAVLLARRGLRVTACDWSPRMIAEAQRRAREANVPVRFEVTDLLYALPYPEKAFDYLFLTNIAYSYLFPRYRRLRFLRQAYSMLKPGGVFLISFTCVEESSRQERLQWLFMQLRRSALFNRDYEPGDGFSGSFVHIFQAEELRREFEEAQFIITDWPWKQGFAVLAKP